MRAATRGRAEPLRRRRSRRRFAARERRLASRPSGRTAGDDAGRTNGQRHARPSEVARTTATGRRPFRSRVTPPWHPMWQPAALCVTQTGINAVFPGPRKEGIFPTKDISPFWVGCTVRRSERSWKILRLRSCTSQSSLGGSLTPGRGPRGRAGVTNGDVGARDASGAPHPTRPLRRAVQPAPRHRAVKQAAVLRLDVAELPAAHPEAPSGGRVRRDGTTGRTAAPSASTARHPDWT